MQSKNQVLEVYLFINPFEQASYQDEKNVLAFAENQTKKTKIHFMPFLNFNTLSQYMSAHHIPEKDLDKRNALYSQMYDACLAYAAATMQGKKKARNFLLALQKGLFEEQKIYSQDLVVEKAREAKLDVPMFLEDKASDYARTVFLADQKVATEMHISSTTSCVIYNEALFDFGVLIEESVTAELLTRLCADKAMITEHLASKEKPALRVLN